MDDLATASNDPLLRAVLSTAADQVIVVLDPACRITVAGSGAERVLGWPAGELLGRHIDTVLLGGGRFRTLVRRDGTEVPVLVSVGALRDEAGTACGAVLVAREIPGDPATDALREANRIKDDFVANVSHELRTPLTMVVGNTEMLLDGDAGELTGPQRRLLGAVERNARRLQRLVGDLLMLSRIQAGNLAGRTAPVLVQDVVRRAVRAAGEQEPDRGPAVDLRLPPAPLLGDGAADDLVRIVGNVGRNALKFTPPAGSVTVQVGQAGGFALVEVTDDGIGIPDDELDAVFEDFFRSSRSRRNETPGTGLGLTIARSIADRHAGMIEIRGRVPAGTAVYIRLPLLNVRGDESG